MKKVIFGQKNDKIDGKTSNRQSKAISFCSYENINSAPLAKPESMSDITNYDDSMMNNSLKSSILRLRDENYDEENLKENNENEIGATSTPRNDLETQNSSCNSNQQINTTSPEFNCTSLSMLNAQINLHSSSIESSLLIDKSLKNNVNLTFSMSNDSKNNNSNSFLMDETDFSSIDKLEVLKPKSKDYILCFNTSVDSSIQSNVNNSLKSENEDEKAEQDFDSGIDIRRDFVGKVNLGCNLNLAS
jgi:hypothetical protein